VKAKIAEGMRHDALQRIMSSSDKYRRSLPSLKYMRGEPYKDEHWSSLFYKLHIPKNISLGTLKFSHFLDSIDLVVENMQFAKDMTARAQGEVTIRDALLELKAWSATAEAKMFVHESDGRQTNLIHEWKDLFNELGDNQSLLSSLKDSQYFKPFAG
jgi:dynein heavy chain 2